MFARPGRFEVMGRQPLVVIEGAHNPPGADTCASVFFEDFDPEGRRILVVGCLQGRDPREMLGALRADEFDLIVQTQLAWEERALRRTPVPLVVCDTDVLATALITDSAPAGMVMFGVEPQALTTGLALTPVVEASLDKLVESVVAELRGLGHQVRERPDPPPRQREWSPR